VRARGLTKPRVTRVTPVTSGQSRCADQRGPEDQRSTTRRQTFSAPRGHQDTHALNARGPLASLHAPDGLAPYPTRRKLMRAPAGETTPSTSTGFSRCATRCIRCDGDKPCPCETTPKTEPLASHVIGWPTRSDFDDSSRKQGKSCGLIETSAAASLPPTRVRTLSQAAPTDFQLSFEDSSGRWAGMFIGHVQLAPGASPRSAADDELRRTEGAR
jgi:hypothetical protein